MALIPSDFLALHSQPALGVVLRDWYEHVSKTTQDFAGKRYTIYTEDIASGLTPQQGLDRDANFWYSFGSGGIEKWDLANNLLLTNSTPYTGLPASVDHMNDGCVHNGVLYVTMSKRVAEVTSELWLRKYDITDLSVISSHDLLTDSAVDTAPGVCISLDGTEIYAATYDIAGSTIINRFNISNLAHLGTITLSSPIVKMQGIAISDDEIFHITSYDNGGLAGVDSEVRLARLDGTVIPWSFRGFNMGTGEIEGCCIYNGIFYATMLNSIPKAFNYSIQDASFLYNDSYNPTPWLTPAVNDEGTIVIRSTTASFFNSNLMFGNSDSANNSWVSWTSSSGELAFRIGTSGDVRYGYSGPNVEHTFFYEWKRNGANVDVRTGVDGVYTSSFTNTWFDLLPAGLHFGIGSAGGFIPKGRNYHRGTAVFSRAITDAEALDVYANFDDMYALFPDSVSYSHIASGGVTTGGAALISKTKNHTASGGITAGGAAVVSKTKSHTASGGIITGGVAGISKSKNHIASGGITTGGAAVTSKSSAGATNHYTHISSGGIITGGTAAISKTKSHVSSGGIITGGSASIAKTKNHTASGGIVTSGSAAISKTKNHTASGGITNGGAAVTSKTSAGAAINHYTYIASGGVAIGGSAVISKTKSHAATGGVITGGAAVTSGKTLGDTDISAAEIVWNDTHYEMHLH